MIVEFGDRRITTDRFNYIVEEEFEVKASRFTKEENIGKKYWKEVAYFTTLAGALTYIVDLNIRTDKEIQEIRDILRSLEALRAEVKELSNIYEGGLK